MLQDWKRPVRQVFRGFDLCLPLALSFLACKERVNCGGSVQAYAPSVGLVLHCARERVEAGDRQKGYRL